MCKKTATPNPTPCEQRLLLSSWVGRRKRLCLNHVKPLRTPLSKLPQQAILFSLQTVFFFFWCRHPFIDKLMAITEPTEASTQLLVLGLKLYPSNMPHMLNEDLTWFMLSLSRVCQNQASEKTAFLAGWLKHCITRHFFTWIIWRMVLSQEAQCFVKVSVSHCSMVTPRRHTPNQLVKKTNLIWTWHDNKTSKSRG